MPLKPQESLPSRLPSNPICFVVMPFGVKEDGSGGVINFDAVYQGLIKPAIEKAELSPLRADEERQGGIMHKPMFERLLLADYAVVDLTTANPNVLYELGIRHAKRPWSTLLLRREGVRLPFNVQSLRCLDYDLDSTGLPTNLETKIPEVAQHLEESKQRAAEADSGLVDSPLYELLDAYPDLTPKQASVFQDRVSRVQRLKTQLDEAQQNGARNVQAIHEDINIEEEDPEIVISLYLAYRAVEAWEKMIELVDEMPNSVSQTVLVQEQLGFALNRAGKRQRAKEVLESLIEKHGPSSETHGLLGRVYKDLWEDMRSEDRQPQAKAYLRQSIEQYRKGFEANWKDPYPGINAVTMMELDDKEYEAADRLLKVVTYSASRRLDKDPSNYWNQATMLEAHVLEQDQAAAESQIGKVLIQAEEDWQLKTTARNLSLIRCARETSSGSQEWIKKLEDHLLEEAAST